MARQGWVGVGAGGKQGRGPNRQAAGRLQLQTFGSELSSPRLGVPTCMAASPRLSFSGCRKHVEHGPQGPGNAVPEEAARGWVGRACVKAGTACVQAWGTGRGRGGVRCQDGGREDEGRGLALSGPGSPSRWWEVIPFYR